MPKEKTPQAVDGVSPSNSMPLLLIYRSGPATPMNMTPRAADLNGLSAFRSKPNKLGCKYQVIDTARLKNLVAFCDDEATGHFCIVPRDVSKMQEWIDSRGQGTHPFTDELLNAIVSQGRT